jgi:hypothetical protein
LKATYIAVSTVLVHYLPNRLLGGFRALKKLSKHHLSSFVGDAAKKRLNDAPEQNNILALGNEDPSSQMQTT